MYNKVYVEITNICNKNCSFCHGHNRVPKQMTKEEFLSVLDKLEGHTKYIYYHLMGEPLTHPQLPEFIRLAGDRGFKSIVTTNGTLLQKHKEDLISAGLHKVNISLHSFEDGSTDDHIRYVDQLADFAIVAANTGVIVSFRLWNQGFADDKNNFALQRLKQQIPGDWADNSRGLRIRDRIFLEYGQRFAWPDSNAEIQGEKFYCYGLKDQFGILCDGTVVPCCLDSEGIINLGNIFTEDLGTILTSQRATDMVQGFRCGKATEELCKRCGYAQRFIK